MRYAIISDLHANRPAVKAVFADIASSDIDKIICLGDIVGYGPNPAEVLEIAYAKTHYFVLGNHDAVIAGKLSSSCFNDNAKRLIEWTYKSLDDKAVKFLRKLPLEAKGSSFRCAHAELANPGRFGYLFDPVDAEESFKACQEQIIFVGHSHVPGIFVMGDRRVAHWLEPTDFGIEDEKRYIVNVGSVGQPRDNGIRASYCIFDDDKKDILFRHIAFDIEEYIDDQRKNMLPESCTYFLDIYHKQAPRPIRDIIDFHRVSAENTVKADVGTVDLQRTVASLRKTKILLLSMLIFCTMALFLATFGYSSQKSAAEKAKSDALKSDKKLSQISNEVRKYMKTEFAPYASNLIQLDGKAIKTQLLSMPANDENGVVSSEHRLRNWSVAVTDPKTQKVSAATYDDKTYGDMQVFRIESAKPDEILISSQEISAEKGMIFSGTVQFKKEKMESGYLELLLEQELENGTRKVLARNIAEEVTRTSSWNRGTAVSMKKSEALSEPGRIRLVIRGLFSGEVLARNCSLRRNE